MHRNMKKREDEQHACELLRDFLWKRYGRDLECCNLNNEDPPDIVATLANGFRWGVEVTQGHQQVERFNTGKRDSLLLRTAILYSFGKAIGEKTASIRKVDYMLKIEPSPLTFQGIKPRLFDREWQKKTEQVILDHINSGKMSPLKGPGFWFKPGQPGNRWAVAIDAGVHNVVSATAMMLRRALSDKASKVPQWKGDYTERWLLILSEYPLAEDADEVRSIVSSLIEENREYLRFSGILWSAKIDSDLVAIPFTASLPPCSR